MLFRSRISPCTIAAAVALGGCSHAADSTETRASALAAAARSASAPAPPADAAPPPEGAAHAARGRGPHALFYIALHDGGLSAAQTTTLTTALDALEADARDVHRKERALIVALARAVSAGKVDETALDPSIDSLATNISVHAQQEKQALQTLHDTLSGAQRKIVVARAEEHEGRARKLREALADGGAPRGPQTFGERGPGRMGFGPPGTSLGFLVHSLDLTPAEQQALRQAFTQADGGAPGPDAWHERAQEFLKKRRALLAAFAGDQFDANAQFDSSDLVAHVQKHWAHEVSFAKALVPILTAEQRVKLAQLAENPPAPHPPPGAVPPQP